MVTPEQENLKLFLDIKALAHARAFIINKIKLRAIGLALGV
jgi:hypothetical protein